MATYSCFCCLQPLESTPWGFFHVINGQASHTAALDSKQSHAVRVLRACTFGEKLLAELDRPATGSHKV